MIILGIKGEYGSFVWLQDIRWQRTGDPQLTAISVAQYVSLRLVYEG